MGKSTGCTVPSHQEPKGQASLGRTWQNFASFATCCKFCAFSCRRRRKMGCLSEMWVTLSLGCFQRDLPVFCDTNRLNTSKDGGSSRLLIVFQSIFHCFLFPHPLYQTFPIAPEARWRKLLITQEESLRSGSLLALTSKGGAEVTVAKHIFAVAEQV